LQRRCQELLVTAVRLPRAVLAIIDQAFVLRRAWRGHRLSGNVFAEQGLASGGSPMNRTAAWPDTF